MRLIVGLGNPGARYRETPHNAGFQVLDRFAAQHHLGDEVTRFQGRFRRGRIGERDIGALRPMTYMNLSGEAVAEALRYLPAEASDLIVVYDEIDLAAGKVRIRPGGGHGGHNGMRSLIECLGTDSFPRIRVGVGRPEGRRDPTGHLLGRVRLEERERFSQTVDRAVAALNAVLEEGVTEAMNCYNGLPAIGEEEQGEEKS